MTAVFHRMLQVYDYMGSHAESVDAQEFFRFGVPRDIGTVSVWQGHAMTIATALRLKHHLVTQTLTRLVALEAIRMINRGSSVTPTVYLILYRPTQAEYLKAQVRSQVTGKFQPATPAQRAQDAINRLNNRVSELEQRIARLEIVQKNDALRDSGGRDGSIVDSAR